MLVEYFCLFYNDTLFNEHTIVLKSAFPLRLVFASSLNSVFHIFAVGKAFG